MRQKFKPFNNSRILIVEDDEITRAVMRAELESEHFIVDEAADGDEACASLWNKPPDLIITDAMMPGMDGFALCNEIRSHPAWADVPILMMTGWEDVESVEKAYLAGATDFITKPVNWPILKHRIRYILRSARSFDEYRWSQKALVAATEAAAAAEAADRAKSSILATVSHELRTPLNAIMGFATIIRDGLANAPRERFIEYAGIIYDASAHLLSIITDILEMAKAERNVVDLSMEDVKVAEIVSLSISIVGEMAHEANIAFDVAVIDPKLLLRADPAKLRQILINLLTNAVKFTPSGGRVLLSVKPESDDWLVIEVVDTGIGIPEEKIDVALAPFGQVDNRLARKFEGTGLGLPLAKRFAELHGGTLEIASQVGKGTTVTVRLPRTPVQPSEQYRIAI